MIQEMAEDVRSVTNVWRCTREVGTLVWKCAGHMPEEPMKGGRRLVLEWSPINLTKERRRPQDRWDRDIHWVARCQYANISTRPSPLLDLGVDFLKPT